MSTTTTTTLFSSRIYHNLSSSTPMHLISCLNTFIQCRISFKEAHQQFFFLFFVFNVIRVRTKVKGPLKGRWKRGNLFQALWLNYVWPPTSCVHQPRASNSFTSRDEKKERRVSVKVITVETGTFCLLPGQNEKGRAGTEEDFLVGDSVIVRIIFAFGDLRSADWLWEESGSKLRRRRGSYWWSWCWLLSSAL